MSKKMLALMLACAILFTFFAAGCEDDGMSPEATFETPIPTMDPITRAASQRQSAKYNFEQTVTALSMEQIVLYCASEEDLTEELMLDSIRTLYDGGVYITGGLDELAKSVASVADEEFTVGYITYSVMNAQYGFVGEASTRVMIIKSAARDERSIVEAFFQEALYEGEGMLRYVVGTMNDEQFSKESILALSLDTVGTPESEDVGPYTVEILSGYEDLEAGFLAADNGRSTSAYIKLKITCSKGDVFTIQAGVQIFVGNSAADDTEEPAETDEPEESEAPEETEAPEEGAEEDAAEGNEEPAE